MSQTTPRHNAVPLESIRTTLPPLPIGVEAEPFQILKRQIRQQAEEINDLRQKLDLNLQASVERLASPVAPDGGREFQMARQQMQVQTHKDEIERRHGYIKRLDEHIHRQEENILHYDVQILNRNLKTLNEKMQAFEQRSSNFELNFNRLASVVETMQRMFQGRVPQMYE